MDAYGLAADGDAGGFRRALSEGQAHAEGQ